MKVIIFTKTEEIWISGEVTNFYMGTRRLNLTIEGGDNSKIKKKDGSNFFDCLTVDDIKNLGGESKSILLKQKDGVEWMSFDNDLGYRVQIGDF